MPSRDVELIIRARNEASKAIDAVNAALKGLIATQGDTVSSAQKTDTVLGQLGAELEKLKAKAAGLEAFGTIVQQLTLAGDAATRLGNDLNRTVSDLAKLKEAATAAAAQTAKLVGEARSASQAYAQQKSSLASAKAALTAINAEVRRAEGTFASLGKQIAATAAPSAELTAAFNTQKSALDALRARQAQLKASLDQERASLKSAALAHKELQTAVKISAAAEQKLEAAAVKTASAVERERASMVGANTALAEVSSIANRASVALGGVEATEKAVSAASLKAAADLNAVAQAMERQRTLRSPATVDQGPAAAATAAYKAQAAAVAVARQQLESLRSVTTQLGAAMAAAKTPTETLARQFILAKAASEQAKAGYLAQATALNQLKGAAQGGFAAFAQTEARIKSFTQSQVQARSISEAFRQALTQVVSSFKQTGQAANQASNGVGVFKRALAGSSNETRTSLGLMQRLRGQVLALAAGYVGLIGAIQGIGAVIGTIRQVEAAQNRLGAIFGQSQEKVLGEMRFLEFQADRLGIQFGVLADQYTQFAVAAKQANFSAEATREIFLAVAEAGRVNKLSIENLQGVFLALQQMISKGKVSSEELRRQMGDRLPGAFNIFAKAMGVSTAELDKMLRAGDLVSNQDTLLKFARQLTKEFSSQLPTALESVTTSLGRFSNNIFQATRLIAQGGFAQGLKSLLDQLDTFFKSSDGQKFFLSVGAALQTLLNGLTFLVQHTDLLAAAFKALIAFKVTQFFSSLIIEITKLTPAFRALAVEQQTAANANKIFAASLTTARVQINSFGTALATLPARVAASTTSFASLRAGMTALAIGGINTLKTALLGLGRLLASVPQLLIAMAAAFAVMKFVEWASQVDDATDAMADHERVMQLVMQAQEGMKDKTNKLASSLKDLTLIEVKKHFLDLLDQIFETKTEFDKLDTRLQQGLHLTRAEEETNQLKLLAAQFQTNEINAKTFLEQLARLSQQMVTPEAADLAAKYLKLGQVLFQTKGAANEMVKASKDLGFDLTQLIPISGQTGQAVGAIGTAAAETKTQLDSAAQATNDFKNTSEQLATSQTAAADTTSTAWERIVARIRDAVATIGNVWSQISDGAQSAWDSIVSIASSAIDQVKSFIDGLISKMNSLWEAAKRALSAQSQASSGQVSSSGHARGGPIHGPGTATSDSVPAWLSKGEWVIKAAAVKKYGAAIFALLNDMRIPPKKLKNLLGGFAMGGPVAFNLSHVFDGVAAFSEGGPVERIALDLSIGNQHIGTVMSPRDVADKLIRFALNENVRSGGRKPNWYR